MRILALTLLAFATTTLTEQAQSTWLGNGANGNWSNGLNWDTPPLSSNTTALTFSGIGQTNTVMNIGSTFILNSLTITNDASSGFIINTGTLQFAGTTPNVQFNGGAGVFLVINSAVDFAANTTFSSNQNSTGALYEINLRGVLTGSSNVSHSGGTGREFVISSKNNTLTGIVTQASGGIFWLANHNALGRGASVNITGGTFASSPDASEAATFVVGGVGYHQQHAQIAGTSGSFQLGGAAASTTAFGFNNAGTTLGSGILGTNAGNHLAKVGTGTLLYTGTGGYAGNLSVRDGILNVQGTNGGGGFSNNTSTGTYTIYGGGTLSQTITSGAGSSDRLGSLTVFSLAGGNMVHASTSTTTGGFSSVVGSLTLAGGQSTVRVSTSNATGTRVSFQNGMTVSTTTGTLFAQGNALGTLGLSGTSATNIAISGATGPASALFIGTTSLYAALALDMRILPFGFAATSTLGDPSTLLTYDTANQSLRGLLDSNYANTFAVPANNVSLIAPTLLAAPAAANALRIVAGGSLDLGTNVLTLSSGTYLNNTGGSVTNGAVNFGPTSNLTAFITTSQATQIGANINAAHLSKNGAGNLTLLGSTVTLGVNGIAAVNAGTLTVAAGSSFVNVGTYQVSRGATLDASALGLMLSTGQTLQGSGTVTGTLSVGTGSTIRPSALGGSATNLGSPGILTVGNTTFQQNGSYEWYINSVLGGQYTQSLLQGTAGTTLDLTPLGTSGVTRFNIKLTSLTLANGNGPVYDNDAAANYNWPIANFPGGITGFDPNKFNIDMTGATWGATAPNLTVTSDGTSLFLTTVPIPEPTTIFGVSVGILALIRLRRKF